MYGIDIASPAIETGTRWVESEGLTEKVRLRVGDVIKLPYEDGLFDAAIDIYTIEFIHEKESYVKEIARVMKSGGLFFILTAIPPELHSIDPEYLEELLQNDFRILKTENPSEVLVTVVAERKRNR